MLITMLLYLTSLIFPSPKLSCHDCQCKKESLNGLTMGQRKGLASSDLIRLNRMYKCNGQNSAPSTRPQQGQNIFGAGQGSGFVGANQNQNWGYYPQQAASFLRQLVSYFFQRSPRQGDDYNSQNNGYGFARSQNNGYGFNGQNDRNGFNGPYRVRGYGLQK